MEAIISSVIANLKVVEKEWWDKEQAWIAERKTHHQKEMQWEEEKRTLLEEKQRSEEREKLLKLKVEELEEEKKVWERERQSELQLGLDETRDETVVQTEPDQEAGDVQVQEDISDLIVDPPEEVHETVDTDTENRTEQDQEAGDVQVQEEEDVSDLMVDPPEEVHETVDTETENRTEQNQDSVGDVQVEEQVEISELLIEPQDEFCETSETETHPELSEISLPTPDTEESNREADTSVKAKLEEVTRITEPEDLNTQTEETEEPSVLVKEECQSLNSPDDVLVKANCTMPDQNDVFTDVILGETDNAEMTKQESDAVEELSLVPLLSEEVGEAEQQDLETLEESQKEVEPLTEIVLPQEPENIESPAQDVPALSGTPLVPEVRKYNPKPTRKGRQNKRQKKVKASKQTSTKPKDTGKVAEEQGVHSDIGELQTAQADLTRPQLQKTFEVSPRERLVEELKTLEPAVQGGDPETSEAPSEVNQDQLAPTKAVGKRQQKRQKGNKTKLSNDQGEQTETSTTEEIEKASHVIKKVSHAPKSSKNVRAKSSRCNPTEETKPVHETEKPSYDEEMKSCKKSKAKPNLTGNKQIKKTEEPSVKFKMDVQTPKPTRSQPEEKTKPAQKNVDKPSKKYEPKAETGRCKRQENFKLPIELRNMEEPEEDEMEIIRRNHIFKGFSQLPCQLKMSDGDVDAYLESVKNQPQKPEKKKNKKKKKSGSGSLAYMFKY